MRTVLFGLLLDLVHSVWEERQVSRERADATLISILRRGTSVCDAAGVALHCLRWLEWPGPVTEVS